MWNFGTTVKLGEKEHFDKEQKVPCKFDCAIKAFISATKVVLGRWLLRTQKSELVSRVNFDRNISPNSKGRSPIFLLGWPALGDCSICDIIPSNLSSGSFFYLPIWQAAVFEVGCHTTACPSSQVIFWKTNH